MEQQNLQGLLHFYGPKLIFQLFGFGQYRFVLFGHCSAIILNFDPYINFVMQRLQW